MSEYDLPKYEKEVIARIKGSVPILIGEPVLIFSCCGFRKMYYWGKDMFGWYRVSTTKLHHRGSVTTRHMVADVGYPVPGPVPVGQEPKKNYCEYCDSDECSFRDRPFKRKWWFPKEVPQQKA